MDQLHRETIINNSNRRSIRPSHLHFRPIRSLIAAVAALLLLTGVVATLPGAAAAQDAADSSMSGHPLVGSWIIDAGGETSLGAFTSDGIVIDTENTGLSGIGTWVATGDRTGTMTLITPFKEMEMDITGNVAIRATLEVNETGDSVSLAGSITFFGLDGTVLFSDDVTGTGIRLPVESPEMAGTPVAGFPVRQPEGTPTS